MPLRPLLLTSTLLLAAAAPPPHATPRYDAIVHAYFNTEWHADPVGSTSLGLHLADSSLDTITPTFIATLNAARHRTLTQLAAIPATTLTPAQRNDRDILTEEIGGALLADETRQSWRHNPDQYVQLATVAIYSLIARNFAPAETRLQDVIERENAIPSLLNQARRNLTAMPPIYIEIALEDAAGAQDFLSKDVPAAFPDHNNELTAATGKADAAIGDFRLFLTRAARTATAPFAYGNKDFQALLTADGITLTPDQVLAAGQAQLAKDRAAFLAISKSIDPAHPDQALTTLAADHPTATTLIATAASDLAATQAFVNTHHIIDLPSQALPKVAETPPFQRAEVFAEMDWPGPFETKANQAYYYITPPDAAQPQAAQAATLAYFNRPFLINLGVHETMPGHFVQYLFRNANPHASLVRLTSQSYTATEGWAHYVEQMMTDEGLSNNDPKLRLAQLQDALLRDCRLIDSVEMHTKGLSLADATTLMQTQCFQPKAVAYKEARRGTADPGYYSYTLGKLMFLKLRADVQAKEGSSFSLAHFHDRVQQAGLVPLAIIRREITGQDGSLL